MAQKPPTGKDARHVTAEALEAKVGIDFSDFYVRLGNRAAELLADGQQRGLVGDALADFVIDGVNALSDEPIERAGRAATSEAFNLGRNLEAQRRIDEIEVAVRSEILDDRTCGPCNVLDGAVVKVNGPVVSISAPGAALLRANGVDPDSDLAYVALMPPNFCRGEDYCRGDLIYQRRAA